MGEALRRAALFAVLGGAASALTLTASPPEHARQVAHVTHDELPVFVETGNGTVSVRIVEYSVGGEGAERLADTLAVFTRRGALRDVLPPMADRNGFDLDLPRRVVVPSRIVVRERTGQRHVYDVERCRVDVALLVFAGPLGPLPC